MGVAEETGAERMWRESKSRAARPSSIAGRTVVRGGAGSGGTTPVVCLRSTCCTAAYLSREVGWLQVVRGKEPRFHRMRRKRGGTLLELSGNFQGRGDASWGPFHSLSVTYLSMPSEP